MLRCGGKLDVPSIEFLSLRLLPEPQRSRPWSPQFEIHAVLHSDRSPHDLVKPDGSVEKFSVDVKTTQLAFWHARSGWPRPREVHHAMYSSGMDGGRPKVTLRSLSKQ